MTESKDEKRQKLVEALTKRFKAEAEHTKAMYKKYSLHDVFELCDKWNQENPNYFSKETFAVMEEVIECLNYYIQMMQYNKEDTEKWRNLNRAFDDLQRIVFEFHDYTIWQTHDTGKINGLTIHHDRKRYEIRKQNVIYRLNKYSNILKDN